MPKGLKWGIIIGICMLLLFGTGYLFRDNLVVWFSQIWGDAGIREGWIPPDPDSSGANPFSP